MRAPEVWRVDVEAETPRLDEHLARLSAVERARAGRFHLDADRARFVVSRGSLRDLLSGAVGCGAGAIEFAQGPQGKPLLARHPALHFNTSHSGRWVLHAFADVAVGIDVEEIRPGMERLDDFAWVLSLDERSAVSQAPRPERAKAMATVWVRKEAYVKALGEGLSRSLQKIGIATGPDGRPMLAFDWNPPAAQRRWSFLDLEMDRDYRACLVHAGPPRPVSVRSYRRDAPRR